MRFIHDQLVQNGDSVDYFCSEDIPRPWDGRIARLSFPLLLWRHAIHAARQGRPYDLINVHEPSAAAISTYRAPAGHPVVTVTTFGVEKRGWELSLEELNMGRGGPSLKTRLVYPSTSLWQSKVGFRQANHILCKNFEDRDYLMKWLELPESKITRFYPGADTLYAEHSRDRDYSRIETLLFAGTWIKRKGTEDLIQAFIKLSHRYSGLKLTVLGAGVPTGEVINSFPSSIRSRVSVLQSANDTENAKAFAAASIYVLPSLFEGTPLTLMEAMMSGLPVITTDTCGMKDVIRHEENGLLIPIRSPEAIESAVARLIDDKGGRARLGMQAQRDALANYTWDKVAAPIGDLYRRLCNGAAKGISESRQPNQ